MRHPPGERFSPLLFGVAAIALVTAVLTGLSRIGWDVWARSSQYAHGPTLVLGFLGTVIGMERAVALSRSWAWMVPALASGSVLAGFLGFGMAANIGMTLAGVALVVVFVAASRIQADLHIWIMGAGAVCWVFAAAGLTFGSRLSVVVPSLAAFLILTIVGERFEMTRLLDPGGMVMVWLTGGVGLVVAGAAWALSDLESGARVAGVGLGACGFWLARYDIARKTFRMSGLTKFMAAALMAGYVWLIVAAVSWVWSGLDRATLVYDAALHAIFLGFVFSMIFAHAPVIVPALSGLAFPFTRWLWVPLITLHSSLAIRVASDWFGWQQGRRWGGMLNAASILVFAVVAVSAVVVARLHRPMSLSGGAGPSS